VTTLTFRPTESGDQTGLLNLAWNTSLEHWPDEAPIDPGVHRHVVRFVRVDDRFVVCKELPDHLAQREYRLLTHLRSQGLPVVTPLGTVTNRVDADGGPLEGVLLTRMLSYAIPYRRLFTGPSSPLLRHRLVDALALLLTRMHLAGFFWGDCSLNNALFRRDAGALRAYVVDTETGELHESLSEGQRRYDIDIATENFVGGLLDMQAGGSLPLDVDPVDTAELLGRRYDEMWSIVTRVELIGENEMWRMQRRITELRDLGFDANEVEVVAGGDGQVRLRPTDVEWLGRSSQRAVPEAVAGYHWLVDRWEPVARAAESVGSLEPAEFFHEVLNHCWFLSEQAGHDVGIEFAAADYLTTVLGQTGP
jgi:Domain of unknown function (DUF4032)/Lipopolysaccharide kinase (Kdo/WaaP) family